MHKALINSYIFLKRRQKLFYAVLILLFLALIYVASQLRFNEDIAAFIPKNKENDELTKILESTKFDENVVMHFYKKPKGSTEDLTELASAFIDSVNTKKNKHVKNIQGYVKDEEASSILGFVYDNAPLFLNEDDYKTLTQKISSDSLNKLMEDNYRTLISPSGIVSKELILKDPLKISLLALNNLNPLSKSDAFKLKNNFLLSQDEQDLLLLLTAEDDIDQGKFIESLRAFKDRNQKTYGDKVEVQFYGGAIIAAANAEQIKKDTLFTVGIAVTFLLLLFILYYKKLITPLILFVPTIFGGLIGLLVLYITRPEVSAISLGIGSVLLGVTVDYSLHILTHIKNGSSIEQLYKNISKPILLSGLTTSLAFSCLLFTNSQALRDLGLFASVSVLVASMFALIFMPHAYRPQKLKTGPKPVKKQPFNILIWDRMANYPFHQNRAIIVIISGVVLLSCFTYNKVIFNENLSDINFIPSEIREEEKNLDALINASSKSLYIVAYADDLETALRTNDSVAGSLMKLNKQSKIESYNSVSTFLQSEYSQQRRLDSWSNFWDEQDRDSIEQQLISAGTNFGFKPGAHKEFYEYIKKDFKPISSMDFENIGLVQLENFIFQKKDFVVITSIVKLKDDEINTVTNSFSDSENVLVVDRQKINQMFLGHLKTDFNKLILYCLVVVMGLLFIFYKSIKLTLVTVLPILFTWFITMGIMGVFGLEFNIFNIIISSFIFGLGVDYSIFITNGLLLDSDTENRFLRTNKISIILSVITTLLGIGALIFAQHPALRSIATISIIGILTALTVAFTIQPLLFKFIMKNRSWAK